MQALLLKNPQNGGRLCILVLVKKKPEISEPIANSDVENRKRQTKYAVSRMYLKNYNISCQINSSAKSNSVF